MNEPTDPTLPTPTAAPVPALEFTLEPGRSIHRHGKPFLVLFRNKEHTDAPVADAAAHQIVALLNNAQNEAELAGAIGELCRAAREVLNAANSTQSDAQVRKRIRDVLLVPAELERYENPTI